VTNRAEHRTAGAATLTRLARRGAWIAACALGLAGCVEAFPRPPAVTPAPQLDPTVFFAGATRGDGRLDVRIGTDRTLRVDGSGRMEPDGRFRLDQTITSSDGSVQRRTWFMQRAPGDGVTATLSDARGAVTGTVRGSLFHLRYLMRHPAVYMEQWMYLLPDGRTVTNHAQVTILGVPWARVQETITRSEHPE